jgi:N-acetylmuramidase/Putative peptidoglycan binding domain
MAEFVAKGNVLSSGGLDEAAQAVGAGAPELWSVLAVETSGCGFLPDRRPKLLFERHIFHRLTGGRFDTEDPDVSQPTAGGYGRSGAHQHDRLAAAIKLDRDAALQSASWGLGQIMGMNFQAAGFASVEEMVTAMVEAEDRQLLASAKFIKRHGMAEALKDHDWKAFARSYNGPDYAAHNYDGLLEHFFQRYSAAGNNMPDLQIRAAQIYLIYRGFNPGAVDGVKGSNTEAAVANFQRSVGIEPTGIIDDRLIGLLLG